MHRHQGLMGGSEMTDIRSSYKKIAFSFCQHYYQTWDTNFPMVSKLYISNPKITYFETKFNNIHSWVNYIKNFQKVWKFEHINFSVTAQPLDNNTILIQVSGTITVNDNVYWNRFSETLIIQRNIWNKWYISNSIFHLTD